MIYLVEPRQSNIGGYKVEYWKGVVQLCFARLEYEHEKIGHWSSHSPVFLFVEKYVCILCLCVGGIDIWKHSPVP